MEVKYEAFIYLLSCALNGETPDEAILTQTDPTELFKMAKAHSVAAMIAMVLEKTLIFQAWDSNVRKKWTEAKESSVRKSIMFDTERSALLSDFEENRIRYMPLKGIILKNMYPAAGMREMADNDIWFDKEKRSEVKQLFRSHGYKVKDFESGNHDVYQKEPFYNFEMHVSLFNDNAYPEKASFFQKPELKMLKDDNNSYGYHFSNEDFYVYVVAHAHKHFSAAGTGIRTLCDLYVLNRNAVGRLNRDYIARQLMALGLYEYEVESCELAKKLFTYGSSQGLTVHEQELLSRYLNSNTYGTFKNSVDYRIHNIRKENNCSDSEAKFKYMISRAFPGRDNVTPFIAQHYYLVPLYWIWRLLYVVPKRRLAIRAELRALEK